jgi:hypothetical protein
LEWFDSNSKQDSKSFENALKYLKRKKKKKGIYFSSQLLAQQPTSLLARPSPTRGPLFRRPWPACLPRARAAPRFAAWAEPS